MFLRILFFILFALNLACEATQPLLLIKMPTRSREERFFETLDKYYTYLSNEVPYHFLITCDLDDPQMNNPRVKEKLSQYPHLSVFYGNSKTKIEACNADIEKCPVSWDVLMLASDDMIPVVKKFDKIIMDFIRLYFPKDDGVLHLNDGSQGFNLNTLPILGKNYYKRFGYIYHPSYKSFFCDTEMTDVSRMISKAVYLNWVLVEHRHPAFGKGPNDDLYRWNDRQWWVDETLYYERKARNFDLCPAEIIHPL